MAHYGRLDNQGLLSDRLLVRLFGSVARGESTTGSDVDFLVELDPDRSLFDLARLVIDLEELLGCKVDVVTEDAIYWLLRRRILKEARPL